MELRRAGGQCGKLRIKSGLDLPLRRYLLSLGGQLGGGNDPLSKQQTEDDQLLAANVLNSGKEYLSRLEGKKLLGGIRLVDLGDDMLNRLLKLVQGNVTHPSSSVTGTPSALAIFFRRSSVGF